MLKLQYFGHLIQQMTHWKNPYCWEKLRAEGKEGIRIWDGWMESPMQYTWTWASPRRCWGTGRPGLLQSIGSQRVRHDWATEQQQWKQMEWNSFVQIREVKHQLAIQCVCVCVFVCAQSCPTLCTPMDHSPPGSSVHGISQERILEWVAISYSSGSSWLRDQTCISCVSCIGRQVPYHCSIWVAIQ